MYNNNYFLLVLTFVSLLLIGCNSGSNDKGGLIPEAVAPKFIEFGLERHKVEKLLKVNDQLIALTDQGLYRYDTQWHALTDTTYHLLDMAIISDTHWIASVKQAERAFFIESGDAGASWQLFDDDFGGEDSGTDGSPETRDRHRRYVNYTRYGGGRTGGRPCNRDVSRQQG